MLGGGDREALKYANRKNGSWNIVEVESAVQNLGSDADLAAGNTAVSSVVLTKVVSRSVPPALTTDCEANPLPASVSA